MEVLTVSELDDMFLKEAVSVDRPIPGESLTASPDQSAPFLNPPEFTKKQDLLEYYFEFFTSEEIYDKLMDSIESGIPLLDIVKVTLLRDFEEGLFNPDLMLIVIEPLIYMLAAMAERAEIDFIIDNEKEKNGIGLLNQVMPSMESPEMGEDFPESVRAQLEPEPTESLLGVR